MIPDCDGQTVRQTESIMAKTALCIASYADALSKIIQVASQQHKEQRAVSKAHSLTVDVALLTYVKHCT